MRRARTALFVTLALAAVLGLAACARRVMPPATAAHAERAQRRWPETSLAELQRGRKLYISHCSGCHQPVYPWKVPPEKWPEELQSMKKRSHLDDDELLFVERYLVTLSAAHREAPAPAAGTAGR